MGEGRGEIKVLSPFLLIPSRKERGLNIDIDATSKKKLYNRPNI